MKDYLSKLHMLEKSSSMLICEHCGAETPAMGAFGICSNCESMIFTSRKVLEGKDHVLLDALDRINSSMSRNEYESAIKIYDGLIAERKEPYLMYAEAIACLKYSNYEITQIGYAREGFMEENQKHRNNASKQISNAKKLLAKLIKIATTEMSSGSGTTNMAYTRFLAQIKMDSPRGARESIAALKKSDNGYMYDYATMAYDSHIGKYDNVIKSADKLLQKDNFPINALYYVGFSLFKKGRAKDAKLLLQELAKEVKNSNLDALLFEIDYQLGIVSGVL